MNVFLATLALTSESQRSEASPSSAGMERILTALGVTKQSSGMERDGLFSSASETTPEEERDLLLYSKYANSVQRVVSLPACRFVGYFEVHEVRSITRDDGERSVGFVVSRVHEPACSATSSVRRAETLQTRSVCEQPRSPA